MATKAEAIVLALEAMTTFAYMGGAYPTAHNVQEVDQTKPKFHIIASNRANRVNNMHVEFFEVQVEASSLENLDAAIEALEKISSDTTTPYRLDSLTAATIAGTIATYTDDSWSYKIDSTKTTNATLWFGRVGKEVSDATSVDAIACIFTLASALYNISGLSITSASLFVTPTQPAVIDSTWTIKGIDADTPVLTADTDYTADLPLTTASATYSSTTTTTLKDTEIEINILPIFNEIIARENWDGEKLGFVIYDLTNRNGTESDVIYLDDASHLAEFKIPRILITYSYTADMPFYINVQPKQPNLYDSNRFTALLEVEAHWKL